MKNNKNTMKFIVPSLIILLLSACSSRPFLPDAPLDSQLHQQQLEKITNWQIEGRLAYIDEQQKHSANFTWQQQPTMFSLDLRTFIGTSILHLEQQPQVATLDMDEGHYTAINATELLTQLTGWRIPVKQLRTWIKGQTTGLEKVTWSDSGWISELRYDGWTVSYNNYQPVKHTVLPHEIRLKKQQRRIILRINQWQTN